MVKPHVVSMEISARKPSGVGFLARVVACTDSGISERIRSFYDRDVALSYCWLSPVGRGYRFDGHIHELNLQPMEEEMNAKINQIPDGRWYYTVKFNTENGVDSIISRLYSNQKTALSAMADIMGGLR